MPLQLINMVGWFTTLTDIWNLLHCLCLYAHVYVYALTNVRIDSEILILVLHTYLHM